MMVAMKTVSLAKLRCKGDYSLTQNNGDHEDGESGKVETAVMQGGPFTDPK